MRDKWALAHASIFKPGRMYRNKFMFQVKKRSNVGVKESETLFQARRLAAGRVGRCGKGWAVEL